MAYQGLALSMNESLKYIWRLCNAL